MSIRFAEVFGVGYVVKLMGGKLDGLLFPLSGIQPLGGGPPPATPENLSGPFRIIYYPRNESFATQAKSDLGPGDRMFTEALFHFHDHVTADGITFPRLSLLCENEMNVGMRGGVIAANSFVFRFADLSRQLDDLTVGENVISHPQAPFARLRDEYMAEWDPNATRIQKRGITRGISFDMQVERIGESAGLGTITGAGSDDVGVIVLLSGKNEAEEQAVVKRAKQQASFLSETSPVWDLPSVRPFLLVVSKEGRWVQDPVWSFAWVFFRKVGTL